MDSYRYTRLRAPTENEIEFRLLSLLPGQFDDELRITIRAETLQIAGDQESHQINKSTLKTWTALSYTWGDLADTGKITVQVEDELKAEWSQPPCSGDTSLTVTKTLIEALRYLRRADVTLQFWIDAICIDQGADDEAIQERNWLVARMDRIYKFATRVCIWLGPGFPGSALAIQQLDRLASHVHVRWETDELFVRTEEAVSLFQQWTEGGDFEQVKACLTRILQYPRFERAWIRQEAFFASERLSSVRVGHSAVKLDIWRKALLCLERLAVAPTRTFLARVVFNRDYVNTTTLLRQMRSSACRDPRDKVYAIIGMINQVSSPGRQLPVHDDYVPTNTLEKTFRDLFQLYTRHYDTLRLLEECGLWQKSAIRPTWIPDWTTKASTQLDLSTQTASSHFVQADCEFLPHDVLRVHGRCACKITQVYSPSRSDDCQSTLKEFARLRSSYMAEASQSDAVRRFSYALLAFQEGILPAADMVSYREKLVKVVTQVFTTALGGQSSPDPSDSMPQPCWTAIAQAIVTLNHGEHILAFADNEYVGIAPKQTAFGDEVWTILGSRALVLLRPVDNGLKTVVGPCFIHGFNWGEALLGALEPAYTVDCRYEEWRSASEPYYYDAINQSSTMWDSRIDWRFLDRHPPMDNFTCSPVPAPPGQPLRQRPNLEYLVAKGIHVERIDLI